jgi:hypothetical protein
VAGGEAGDEETVSDPLTCKSSPAIAWADVGRKSVKGSGISKNVMHAELVRIDERLTAIEKASWTASSASLMLPRIR